MIVYIFKVCCSIESMRVVDSASYFARAVSYSRKMFIKLITGVKVIQLVFCVADEVAK
jgi:hypothetical protein